MESPSFIAARAKVFQQQFVSWKPRFKMIYFLIMNLNLNLKIGFCSEFDDLISLTCSLILFHDIAST